MCYDFDMKQYRVNFKKGFTLVELLVVISIIGILTAILTVNFNQVRVDTRNQAFQTELKEMQLALELYKDKHNKYPDALTYVALEPQLVPTYTSRVVKADQSDNKPHCAITYTVNNTEGWYKIVAERCYAGATGPTDGIGPNHRLARCPSTCPSCPGTTGSSDQNFFESYAIYSPGGACK